MSLCANMCLRTSDRNNRWITVFGVTPKPLGTELKKIACDYLRMFISLGICRSKDDTCGKDFVRQLKNKTKACYVRLMRAANQRPVIRLLVR